MKKSFWAVLILTVGLTGCGASRSSETSGNPFVRAYLDGSVTKLNDALTQWQQSEEHVSAGEATDMALDALKIYKLASALAPQDSGFSTKPFVLVQDSVRYAIGHTSVDPPTHWGPDATIKRGPRGALLNPNPFQMKRLLTLHSDGPIHSVYLSAAFIPKQAIHTGGAYDSLLSTLLWDDAHGIWLSRPAATLPDSTIMSAGKFVSQSLGNLGNADALLKYAVSVVVFDWTKTKADVGLISGDGNSVEILSFNKDGSNWKLAARHPGGAVD